MAASRPTISSSSADTTARIFSCHREWAGHQIRKTRPSHISRPARQAEHPANTMISADRTVIAFGGFSDRLPVLIVAGPVLDGDQPEAGQQRDVAVSGLSVSQSQRLER